VDKRGWNGDKKGRGKSQPLSYYEDALQKKDKNRSSNINHRRRLLPGMIPQTIPNEEGHKLRVPPLLRLAKGKLKLKVGERGNREGVSSVSRRNCCT